MATGFCSCAAAQEHARRGPAERNAAAQAGSTPTSSFASFQLWNQQVSSKVCTRGRLHTAWGWLEAKAEALLGCSCKDRALPWTGKGAGTAAKQQERAWQSKCPAPSQCCSVRASCTPQGQGGNSSRALQAPSTVTLRAQPPQGSAHSGSPVHHCPQHKSWGSSQQSSAGDPGAQPTCTGVGWLARWGAGAAGLDASWLGVMHG